MFKGKHRKPDLNKGVGVVRRWKAMVSDEEYEHCCEEAMKCIARGANRRQFIVNMRKAYGLEEFSVRIFHNWMQALADAATTTPQT